MRIFLFLLIALSACVSIPPTERQAMIKECTETCAKAGKGECLYVVPSMNAGRNVAILATPKFWCMADEKRLELQQDAENRRYDSARNLL